MENITDNSEWSTHQPLIQATIELYLPIFILELGIGTNSTPIFINSGAKLLCVEHNKEWIDYIKTKYGEIEIIQHKLNDKIKLATHLYDIDEITKNEISGFYNDFQIPQLNPNLLFVDQYTCCRTLSINSLGPKFDIIIYHDCQPAGIPWYSYDLININGYNKYFLKASSSWTGLMVKENVDLGFDKLNNIIKPHIYNYTAKNSAIKNMEFTDKY
jgi:hypothetical protein